MQLKYIQVIVKILFFKSLIISDNKWGPNVHWVIGYTEKYSLICQSFSVVVLEFQGMTKLYY